MQQITEQGEIMTIERHRTNQRMSQATVHNGVAYFTGQVGTDPEAGVGEQTKQVLGRIDELLELTGSDREHLLGANVWLADIATFDEMNEAWEAWVPEGKAPVRATVESKLAAPHWKVEIMAWAAIR
jgi:enamine deaminase RidA (YjgF/YER057c/UK114 family)